MFIKFERDNRDIFINKDHIVSIKLEEHGVCQVALSFYLTNDVQSPYPSYCFNFRTKEHAEKVLAGMFSKAYQDNTLIVFGKESGLME